MATLTNLGNTCYINTCIQILSYTEELNNLLKDEKTIQKIKEKNIDGLLLSEWNSLRELMQSTDGIISPMRFLKIIQHVAKKKNAELFAGYMQNDINEFFFFLIESFHNALSRNTKTSISGTVENKTDKLALEVYKSIQNNYKNGYSEIYDIFNGMSVSIISDFTTNKQLNYKCETYSTLELPIPTHKMPTLEDCFDLYTEEEEIVGENAWFDEKQNKKIDIKKKILFWSFPKVLVITLKRFTSVDTKNQKKIHFPIDNLDLTKYVVGYNKNIYKYKLYGICNHHGRVPFGGHYTSLVKRDNHPDWFEYNDETLITHKNDSKIVTQKAYCLFYKRV
jgi:ubiquitin C-terminal hydrolase|uniref:USP domain-containing protein n=1 Tax=viral metagenome TaxID=1070528 RepID=A0A6C0IM70_9ZZZZ